MRFPRSIVLAAAAFTNLLLAACGIFTAPLSVPGNIAANANFELHGPVLDSHGNPLSNVLLHQTLEHQFWTPIQGYAVTNEPKLLSLDRYVNVSERGRSLTLEFSHPGYHPANYSFSAENSHDDLIITPQGEWKLSPDFPIVLYPDVPDAILTSWKGALNYADYPRAKALNLDQLSLSSSASRPPALVDITSESPPAGTAPFFYITLTPQKPTPINDKNEIDARDVNLPAQITLHITGHDSGFVRMPIRPGFAPLQASDNAPDTGYAPALTIGRARLKEMRTTGFNLATGHSEYFFFRANNRFGKGFLSWSRRVESAKSEIAPTEFYIGLWLQPQPNNPNLTSYNASPRR